MPSVSDSPFYRVTAKALIFDAEHRLLVLKNRNGNWELPGGGWEHDESFEECLQREIYEELGVRTLQVKDVAFMYRGYNRRRNFYTLRIAAHVQLDSCEFVLGEEMEECKFVDKAGFFDSNLHVDEGDIASYAAILWP